MKILWSLNKQFKERINIKKSSIDLFRIKDEFEKITKDTDKLEAGILIYFLKNFKIDIGSFKSKDLRDYIYDKDVIEIFNLLENGNVYMDIEVLIDLFEILLHIDTEDVRGIVFTPKYISDFIVEKAFYDLETYSEDIKIIDPGCGCGIFLVSTIDYLSKKFDVSPIDIINNNVYGIDIVKDNVIRTRYVLECYLLSKNIIIDNVIFKNIIAEDSLSNNWCDLFSVNSFDYVVGNPPYLNTHEMSRDKINFLKENFVTTKQGSFNLFYAFIEQALNNIRESGLVAYIIPNNYLTIKAAKELREFLQENKYINKIIDFKDNMIFKPVRTYNSICFFSKSHNDKFKYSIVNKNDDIESCIKNLKYYTMDTSLLDNHRWVISDKKTLDNIKKIESQIFSIKPLIRTGIATLKDEVFLVEKLNGEYIKKYNGLEYRIDRELISDLYKISDIKEGKTLDEIKRYIIFPYVHNENGYRILDEITLKNEYVETYQYLKLRKRDLDTRDKGKPNTVAWYAYGRSQGLNNWGRKLIFPTFSDIPKFTLIEDKQSLICNGYSILESDYIELEILEKILNSKIMDYYIKNTSYTIDGGYYCYQKKYIEKFTIPSFSEEELKLISRLKNSELDEFLIKKYDLK